jgi:hypothetical protein
VHVLVLVPLLLQVEKLPPELPELPDVPPDVLPDDVDVDPLDDDVLPPGVVPVLSSEHAPARATTPPATPTKKIL